MKRHLIASVLSLALLAPNAVSAKANTDVLKNIESSVFNDSSNLSKSREVELVVVLKNDNSDNILSNSAKELKIEKSKRALEDFKNELRKRDISYEIEFEYDLVLCGLAIRTDESNVEKIRSIGSVDYVQESMNYIFNNDVTVKDAVRSRRVRSTDSNRLISIKDTEGNSHRGEGMVVSVIDSGVDVNHPSMRISDINKARYKSADDINRIKSQENINVGKWNNNKVVFAYNYFTKSDDVKESKEESHGMHVSGIAVGNPEEKSNFYKENGELISENIIGVAPEAQLMFMNVFNEKTGTTSSAIYAKAIEDSVKLGADSINMSLGSINGTLKSVDKVTVDAINNAKKSGAVVAIAAGNDGVFGDGFSNPVVTNPDYGTLGSPAVAEDSLAVASINTEIERNHIIKSNDRNLKCSSIYRGNNGESFMAESDDTSYEYVDGNLGRKEDISEDVKDKVVLIKRGKITFAEKILNAQAKGAKGVIIYNHESGGEEIAGMNFGDDKNKINIPSVFVGNSTGEFLKNAEVKEVTFTAGLLYSPNAIGGQMSDFSSYGISTDGEFKPEITAPGGQIYSAANDGKYVSMNGTSMATPHVAGAIPIVKKSLKERHPDIKKEDEYKIIKAVLMSTAVPVKEGINSGNIDEIKTIDLDKDILVSPRKQGAGLLNVEKALKSDLYAIGNTDTAKVWLGNVKDTLDFEIEVFNLGDEDRNLSYSGILNTEKVQDNHFILKTEKLDKIEGQIVRVPSKGSEKVKISVDISKYHDELIKKMPKGYFLEGFIFFKSEDGVDEISVPFCSFAGEWENLDLWEKPIYDFSDSDIKPMYTDLKNFNTEATCLISNVNNKRIVLGYDEESKTFNKEHIAISPNGDGIKDSLTAKMVFYRNAEDVNIEILRKEDGKSIRKMTSWSNTFMKNSSPNKENIGTSSVIRHSQWDGTDGSWLSRQDFPDGHYIYKIKGKSTAYNAKEQELAYDVVLDRVSPEIGIGKIEGTEYIPDVKEDLSGIEKLNVYYKDNLVEKSEDGRYILDDGAKLEDIKVIACDYAGNISEKYIKNIIIPPVPSPGEPVPSPEEPVPSPEEPVPSPGEPVPSPGKPVPSPIKPVPVPTPVPMKPIDPIEHHFERREKERERRENKSLTKFENSHNEAKTVVNNDKKFALKERKILPKINNIKKADFKDTAGHWSENAVNYVTSAGLFKGIDKDKFGPDIKLNKGMIMTLLYRLSKEPQIKSANIPANLKGDEYYANAVKWAIENNILSENVFDSNLEVTREDIAMILDKYIDVAGISFDLNNNKVNDINNLNNNSKRAIERIVSLGIMKGKGNNTFDPSSSVTRAEFAQILINIINNAK